MPVTSIVIGSVRMRRAIVLVAGCLACGQAAGEDGRPGQEVQIALHLAQAGAVSGIRNTLSTRWLPAGAGFAGLSGRIALGGNAPGFDEALVVLGTSQDDRAACLRRDGTTLPAVPVLSRLWAGILKSNSPEAVAQSADLTLPVPMALPPAGACLVTVVSAGYPFLRRDAALYAAAQVRLAVRLRPGQAAVQGFGMGGEFRMATGGGASLSTYVGVQALRPLVLDAIAATLSAAPVLGAPPGAGWSPLPQGGWHVATRFVLIPAAACGAAHLAGHPAGADLIILRSGAPAVRMLPPGYRTLLSAPMASGGSVAAQASAIFTPPAPVALAPGDCLVAWQSTAGSGPAGMLDVEGQSTAYLRRP